MAGKTYKQKAFSFFSLSFIFLLISLSLLFLKIKIIKQTYAQTSPLTITVCPEDLDDRTGCQFFGAIGIQQAIDTAQDGDKVLIKEGIYKPTNPISIIWKNLTIVGEGYRKTIISGARLPPRRVTIFEIQGSQINLGHLQIVDAITNDWIGHGIEIYSTGLDTPRSLVHIYGVEIKNVSGNGILIIGSQEASNTPNTVRITNSLIHHNSIGIQIVYKAGVEIINNVIAQNINNTITHQGTGIWINEALDKESDIIIKNNIIATNSWTGGILALNRSGKVSNSYNLLGGNTQDYINISQGIGDILGSPRFSVTNDYRVDPDSPAIHSGDPQILNPDGSRSDIGAYGGPGACNLDSTLPGCPWLPSPSPTPFPPNCPTKPQGDANCDGNIDLEDYYLWKKEFDGTLKSKNADFNGDRLVDLVDFEIWRRSFYQ